MKTKIKFIWLSIVCSILSLSVCLCDGDQGPAGLDAEVYYSEWFSPVAWTGSSGDWYFEASAPDLTEDVVEAGVVLAYAWLEGDLYGGTAVRPLPTYAVGANWSFLIYTYGFIEFTCDSVDIPSTGHQFRFVAIPGTIPALRSDTAASYSEQVLRNMSYKEICESFNIPE